jgi:hypothetical protein
MAKGRKTLPNGRNAIEQYAKISYAFLLSPAWCSLNGSSMKVWWALRARFNGGNNGKIHLSYEEATALLGMGKASVARAFTELQKKGFLRLTQKGHWYGRKANEWLLATLPIQGREPMNDWKNWQPEQQKSKRGTNTERVRRDMFLISTEDQNYVPQ